MITLLSELQSITSERHFAARGPLTDPVALLYINTLMTRQPPVLNMAVT